MAYLTGAQGRNITYIVDTIEHLLALVYCRTHKELDVVFHALEEEKARFPRAAKQFDTIISNLHKAMAEIKHRLEYFLHVWKEMISTMFGAVHDTEKTIAATAPAFQLHAPQNAVNFARMMYREIQKLAVMAYNASIEVEDIKLHHKAD